tara:strand:- start:15 stop:833 length:819 start_codon:yes stop_codon:yes gene_type:complete
MKYFHKNIPDWKNDELIKSLDTFQKIYNSRPIKNNVGGMQFPHMFATYFILKKINPSFVIESGVFKGQSTWLIEKTLPNSKILSIDIDLTNREYISKKAEYSNLDFKHHDFSNIPYDTLVFFDDHVSHYERLMQAKFFNIKNIILEDNYSESKGDFYSIKHSYQGFGFNHNYKSISLIKTLYLFFNEILKKIFLKNYYISKDKIISRLKDHKMNKNDFSNIEKNIDIYFEFPPLLFHSENSTKPIFENNNNEFEITREELLNYNHITYIKLK